MSTTPKPRNTLSSDVRDEVLTYFDNHREDIKYAYKGYLKRAKDAYEAESGHHLTDWQFRRLLETYRLTKNCPIEYVPNKYYKPNRNYCMSRYVQKQPEQHEEHEQEASEEHTTTSQ